MRTSDCAATAAIVHAADGVRFVATAECTEALFAQLAEYIRGRHEDVLWADAAGQVRRLLDDGNLHAAVTQYFARTGERWDEERLDLVTMHDGETWIPDEERMADARR